MAAPAATGQRTRTMMMMTVAMAMIISEGCPYGVLDVMRPKLLSFVFFVPHHRPARDPPSSSGIRHSSFLVLPDWPSDRMRKLLSYFLFCLWSATARPRPARDPHSISGLRSLTRMMMMMMMMMMMTMTMVMMMTTLTI